MDWITYLDEEVNGFHREDYYLAQVAMVTAQANSKHPEKIELEHYLLGFESKVVEVQEDVSEISAEEHERKIKESSAASKALWFGRLGVPV